MKLLVLTFLICVQSFSFGSTCSIRKPIVSLSGPVSYLLRELKLIKDPNLYGISSFHHFIKGYKGKRVSGGMYLSIKSLENSFKKNYTIFSDESLELEKRLAQLKSKVKNLKDIIFISTKNLDPFEVSYKTIDLLFPYLSASCVSKITKIKNELNTTKVKISKINFPKSKTFVFYLGDKSKYSKGQTALVKDSFNLTFLKNKSFKTYPSDLAYLSPSQKILKRIEGEILHLGLAESNEKDFRVEKIGKNTYNFFQQGILYPGLSQVHFMKSFTDWVSQQKFL